MQEACWQLRLHHAMYVTYTLIYNRYTRRCNEQPVLVIAQQSNIASLYLLFDAFPRKYLSGDRKFRISHSLSVRYF